jgi:hypothetical protein
MAKQSTVDLGARGKLFAALSSANDPEYTANLATRTLFDTIGRAWGEQPFSRVMKAEGVIVVPRKLYPLLVTFTDINDPKTVKFVDPDDLSASFGPGVSLKSITLEITDDDVTEGKISGVLRWLETIGDGMLDGRSISTIDAESRLANDLSRLDFERS